MKSMKYAAYEPLPNKRIALGSFNYSASEQIVKEILKIEGKAAQLEEVKKIENETRRKHVIELLFLYYRGLQNGFKKF